MAKWTFHSSTCDYGLGYPCRCGGAEAEADARWLQRLIRRAAELLEEDGSYRANANVEAAYLRLRQACSILDKALNDHRR